MTFFRLLLPFFCFFDFYILNFNSFCRFCKSYLSEIWFINTDTCHLHMTEKIENYYWLAKLGYFSDYRYDFSVFYFYISMFNFFRRFCESYLSEIWFINIDALCLLEKNWVLFFIGVVGTLLSSFSHSSVYSYFKIDVSFSLMILLLVSI